MDAVVVCTPPNTHYPMARYFLENGVHVLCEKPLTLASQEVQDLVNLGEARGCRLMMASKFRYVDDVIAAKAIIESGTLGKIVLYENAFCSKVLMGDRWNAEKTISGGGVLIDNGSHAVDIVRYLLGPIEEVQAQMCRKIQDLDVELTARRNGRKWAGQHM